MQCWNGGCIQKQIVNHFDYGVCIYVSIFFPFLNPTSKVAGHTLCCYRVCFPQWNESIDLLCDSVCFSCSFHRHRFVVIGHRDLNLHRPFRRSFFKLHLCSPTLCYGRFYVDVNVGVWQALRRLASQMQLWSCTDLQKLAKGDFPEFRE